MEGQEIKKDTPLVRILKLLLKLAVTVLCFWYISHKINFADAKKALFSANFLFLFISVLLLVLSKLFSSFRLNIYFGNIGLFLPQWKNIKLYWLGMFYNLFLPGAISGDAYKVILLNRKYKTSVKKTSAAVLLDRFSGLLALGLILSAFGIVVLKNHVYDMALASGSVIAVLVLYYIIKFLFKDFLPGFWPTFFWGIAVQLTQVVCVYFILMALRIPVSNPEWIFIFLAAAVISVLPVSLGGGLGTREFVFLEGAKFFHLDPQTGVVISLLFYLVSVIASLPGLFYVFTDPLKEAAQ